MTQEGARRDRGERLPLSTRDRLVGAWTLASLAEDGGEAAEGAEGLALYTPDGHVAVQVTRAGGEGGALAGPCELDEDGGSITQRVSRVVAVGAADGLGDGVLELADDELVLTAPSGTRLVWRRARPEV
ncbi:hypothetical protein [Georgenia sp. AZ-5]|uniref:hypothetical protein n=1 Tax=Georgenia sp. AZ-5 TaxID=3367526 RepID=UPI003754BA89